MSTFNMAGLGSLCLLLFALHETAPAASEETTYYRHVEPILRRRCIGCHRGARPRGGLSLESLDRLRAGGGKGPSVVPGKPGESLLFLLASRERRPVMPPKKEDALTAGEVAVLRAWIEGGAAPGEAPPSAAPSARALLPPSYPRAPAVTALAYSNDGDLLLVAGYGEVLVHDAEGAGSDPDRGTAPRERLVGEAERLNALSLSPAGLWLAAAGGSPGLFGEVQIWDATIWELERSVRLGKDTLFAVAFSPDGSRIAAAGTDRTVWVLDTVTGAEILAAEIHADWVTGVAFTGDGARVVSAGRDRTIKSFDVEGGGRVVDTVATWNEPVLTLAARRGSGVVLAAGEGKTPVLLDALRGKELKKLEGQPDVVLASAFSRDGGLLAVAGAEGEVRVYGTDDGARRAALRGAKDWVYAVAFSPDGERIAIAGYEGVVRVYDVKDAKEVRAFIPVLVTAAGGK